MNQTQSLEALRQANPRHRADFADWAARLTPSPQQAKPRRWPVIGIPAAATLVAVVIALVAVGPPVGPLAVPPAEAMQRAVTASVAAADRSGTVDIEITQDGELWVAKTVTWHGTDLAVSSGDPSQTGRGDLLVVDGVMYGPDPEVAGGWIEMGPPESVDPDSGTTPDELLLAVHEDAGGATLQRITAEMTDLTVSQAENGSTIYVGKVPAGALARESSVKQGETLRVLPYGNIAHDAASNPASLIDISITVGADDTISELQATWGGESSWSYRLSFDDLGSTAPLEKPANAKPCARCFLPPE
jgi:hypothetical protein